MKPNSVAAVDRTYKALRSGVPEVVRFSVHRCSEVTHRFVTHLLPNATSIHGKGNGIR